MVATDHSPVEHMWRYRLWRYSNVVLVVEFVHDLQWDLDTEQKGYSGCFKIHNWYPHSPNGPSGACANHVLLYAATSKSFMTVWSFGLEKSQWNIILQRDGTLEWTKEINGSCLPLSSSHNLVGGHTGMTMSWNVECVMTFKTSKGVTRVLFTLLLNSSQMKVASSLHWREA